MNSANAHSQYTLSEEVASSVIHGLGAALSVAALSVLVTLASVRGTVWHIISFSVYGASLVILYLASTLYHAIASPRAKKYSECSTIFRSFY